MPHDDKQLTVGDLYPEYSKEELIEAEANLRRFAAILLRVYERTKEEGIAWDVQSEHEEFEEEPLTESSDGSTIPSERSNSST